MKTLAVIPARSGSKGLPGKNTRPLLGKPLFAWSVEQALACRSIGDVILSTDDEMMAEAAGKMGADVPFLRPDELATDRASTVDVLIHLLEQMRLRGQSWDLLVLLQPTNPLREVSDIDAAVEKLIASPDATGLVAVTKVERNHPNHVVQILDGFIKPAAGSDFDPARRQDLPALYAFCGTLYVVRIADFMVRRSFYHEKTVPYIIPKEKAFDIDDQTDFDIVEMLMRRRMEPGRLRTGDRT